MRAYFPRRAFSVLLVLILVLSLFSCTSQKPYAVLHDSSQIGYIPCAVDMINVDVSSEQAFIYELETNRFIYLKGEESIVYPASTVKLLTALFALSQMPADELITVGDEVSMIGKDSSIAYVREGHVLTLEMLIQGMLIASGNDAAYAIAAAVGRSMLDDKNASARSAIDAFVNGMNEYAVTIGTCGSNFVSPDGYEINANYTTLEDMVLVSKCAYENELIMKYAGMPFADVVYSSGQTNTWKNTNLMLDSDSKYYNEKVSGLKTGSLGRGNYNLICTVESNGKNFIIGVFASKSKDTRFEDMQTLIASLPVSA